MGLRRRLGYPEAWPDRRGWRSLASSHLRSLEAGPELTSAANLSLSREGLVVASYPSHHVAVFTINGKKLRSELHSDNVQVRCKPVELRKDASWSWTDGSVFDSKF